MSTAIAPAMTPCQRLVTLYDSPISWPTLRSALAMAMAGNGRTLLTLSDLYDERNPPQIQPHPVHYAGTPPILVVGTIHDPATPYPSALQMTDQLRSTVLLTYNGDGHTAYHRGSNCINTAVDDYLTQAAFPVTGTICQPDRPPTS